MTQDCEFDGMLESIKNRIDEMNNRLISVAKHLNLLDVDYKQLNDNEKYHFKSLKKCVNAIQSYNKPFLSTNEVCHMMNICRRTLYNYRHDYDLKVYCMGGKRYYKSNDVLRIIEDLNNAIKI